MNPTPTDLAPKPDGHHGDCTIYSSLHNGNPFDGMCTCGYGLKMIRNGDWDHIYSKERVESREWIKHKDSPPSQPWSNPPKDLAPCCGKRWDEHLGIVGTCQELRELKRVIELLEEDNGIFGVTTQTTASFALSRLEEQRKHIAALDANNSSAYKKIDELADALKWANKRIQVLQDEIEQTHREYDALKIISEARLLSINKQQVRTFELMKAAEKIEAYEACLKYIGDDQPNDKRYQAVRAREVLNKFRFVPQEKGEGEPILVKNKDGSFGPEYQNRESRG